MILGWKAYKLGPGSSNNMNEFNEANFKLTLNLEYRSFFKQDHGAFFFCNIWNILDNINDPAYRFDGFKDLNEIAIASGLGLRMILIFLYLD